jgi:hypothetical protein
MICLAGQSHHGTAGSLGTTYFHVDDNFFQQQDSMAMGSSLGHTVA